MENSSGGLILIRNLVRFIFPEVNCQLDRWKRLAGNIGDDTLRTQALLSIEKKKFHCQGGSAYALYPSASFRDSVSFIVAFQTISDYLDNLCDRTGVYDEMAFRQLHLSMIDAVAQELDTHDYYLYYPQTDDGGYLQKLVAECRLQIAKLPSIDIVRDKIKQLVSYYCELQVYKHISLSMREEKLMNWAAPLASRYPDVSVWEFCAATGSTLGVFLLFAAAQSRGLEPAEADALFEAYFPWVCSLHILLDYFIDADEDIEGGDFTFIGYYNDSTECTARLSFFVKQSLLHCKKLNNPDFHITIIRGLLALYLSDPKVGSEINRQKSRTIIKQGGGRAQLYHCICRLLRKFRKL